MKTIFSDNRILGDNKPENAVTAGKALGTCFTRVAVGRDGKCCKNELALISGLISAGTEVILLEDCMETELFFASDICDCNACLYVRDDPLLKIELRAQGGIVLNGKDRAAVNSALDKEPDSLRTENREGSITQITSLKTVYKNNIARIFPANSRYSVSVTCSGQPSGGLFRNTGGEEELIVSLSSDGTKASAFAQKSGFVSMEELILICCLGRLEKGEDIALPFSFPYIVNKFAEGFSRKVYRYYTTPGDDSDNGARKLALRQRFTLDGVHLAAEALRVLAEKNMDFVQIREYIPKFYMSKRFVELEKERAKQVFRKFSERLTPDGAAFAGNSSRIVMKPSATGKGIWLTADSFSMETASELCAGIEERLKKGNF